MPIEAPGPLKEVTKPTVRSAAEAPFAARIGADRKTARQNRDSMANLHSPLDGSKKIALTLKHLAALASACLRQAAARHAFQIAVRAQAFERRLEIAHLVSELC